MRRPTLYLVLSLLAAAVFVRLGVWQLSRLGERRARNAIVSARLAARPGAIDALPGDSASAHYRRVHVRGTLDYAREIALVNRQHDGSPGVNLLTPLHVEGSERVVLVNRGWVYSADGTRIDRARWREGDALDADGWIEYPSRQSGSPTLASATGALRWLDSAAASSYVGAPIAPYYVVLDPDATPSRERPVRLTRPALDEGPHKSYAIQWFCFATIAIVGGVVFVRKERVG